MARMCGCDNCKYLKRYTGGYFEPDDYECLAAFFEVEDANDWSEEIQTRVWEDGEMWEEGSEPLCPYYQRLFDIDIEEDIV